MTNSDSNEKNKLPSIEDIRLEIIRLEDVMLDLCSVGLGFAETARQIIMRKQAYLNELKELAEHECNSVADTTRS